MRTVIEIRRSPAIRKYLSPLGIEPVALLKRTAGFSSVTSSAMMVFADVDGEDERRLPARMSLTLLIPCMTAVPSMATGSSAALVGEDVRLSREECGL